MPAGEAGVKITIFGAPKLPVAKVKESEESNAPAE